MMPTYIIQTFWANKVYAPWCNQLHIDNFLKWEQFSGRCQAQSNGAYFTLLNSKAGAYFT